MNLANVTIDETVSSGENSVFSTLKESAKVEFQAAMQLLAERAMFLLGSTSVAIAVKNSEAAVTYAAAAGAGTIMPGDEMAPDNEFARLCLNEAKVVRNTLDAPTDKFQLFVPVVRDGTAIGLFELISRFEFQDVDVTAIQRLSELVTVAHEQKVAAEGARARLFERSSAMAEAATVQAHKVATETEDKPSAEPTPVVPAPNFSSCSSCGFPVSAGRNLCVDCEQKLDPVAAKPTELFAMSKHESWISAHGYTIASAIVTILAAAIILWLRR